MPADKVEKSEATPDLVGKALTAAYHALRGYQYGNGDPTSAEETADYVHNALELYKLKACDGCGESFASPSRYCFICYQTARETLDTLKQRVEELTKENADLQRCLDLWENPDELPKENHSD